MSFNRWQETEVVQKNNLASDSSMGKSSIVSGESDNA